MYRRTALAAVLVAFIATPAFANQCPRLIAQIEAELRENTEIVADVRALANSLRLVGRKLHTSSEHDASIAVLNEAKTLLGI